VKDIWKWLKKKIWGHYWFAYDAVSGIKSAGVAVPFAWTGDREMPNKWTYFTDDEVQGLDIELVAMLDRARGLAGVPFVITCGLRTPEQNAALPESVKDSAHLTGNAVDLACEDSVTRFAMLRGLILAGFKRIGIYSAHIHADNSLTLPDQVCWYSAGT